MKAAMTSLLTTSAISLCFAFSGLAHAQTAVPASTAVQTIHLTSSSQHVLPMRQVPTRIAIANPEIADANILIAANSQRTEILLTGLKPGKTDLSVWFENQRTPSVWTLVVESDVTAALQQAGHAPTAQIAPTAQGAVVSGHSDSILEHQAAHQAAVASSEAPPLDFSTVGHTGMVQIEVKIAELSSNVIKEIGIDWSGNTSGGNWQFNSSPNVISNGFNIIFSGSKHFTSRLNLLQSNGLARVLAEPTLVAMSGQSASFLSGGSIPVPTAGGLGTQNVEYKDFGIGLTVSPTVLANNRIALKVAPEASELDYTNAILSNDTQIPAFKVRKTDTFVELGDGESFVISGLVSRNTTSNVDKMPFLGELPIIGSFFRNMRYMQDERELVIVVTPRLVRPLSADTQLILPGDDRVQRERATNGWGAYLMGPIVGQPLPGFSY